MYAVGSAATFIKYGIDPQEAAMIVGNIDSAREDERDYARVNAGKPDLILPTVPGRWRTYYENIADVLTKGAEPLVHLAEVRRAIAVLEAAFRSAKTGAVVTDIE